MSSLPVGDFVPSVSEVRVLRRVDYEGEYIAADARRLELGNIWYGPEAQNTCANTEAAYLMLCEAFDCMAYRRVEWKCDALNERSRSAALRLGFTYEGLFRQHMIVKDRNRDTTWFAMLDTEWSRVKENMEQWLYHNPGGLLPTLKQLGFLAVNPPDVVAPTSICFIAALWSLSVL